MACVASSVAIIGGTSLRQIDGMLVHKISNAALLSNIPGSQAWFFPFLMNLGGGVGTGEIAAAGEGKDEAVTVAEKTGDKKCNHVTQTQQTAVEHTTRETNG